jgi:hypothetical protein
MFRFDIVKPEIQEIIEEREVSKESLRNVFFHSLLELERLRGHLQNLEIHIEFEKDLFDLLKLGDRRLFTYRSILRRKRIVRKVYPLLVKAILDEYMKRENMDRWDLLILYNEEEIMNFLSGKLGYRELIERTMVRIEEHSKK